MGRKGERRRKKTKKRRKEEKDVGENGRRVEEIREKWIKDERENI